MTPHSSQDDDSYRTAAEVQAAAAADPIPVLRQSLLDRGLLTVAADAELVCSVVDGVVADQDRALNQPEPEGSRADRWLFAGDQPHPYRSELDRGPLPSGVFRD